MGMADRSQALYDVVDDLSRIDVFDLDGTVIKPNNNTDRVIHGGATLRGAWPQLVGAFLTPQQEQFLAKLVELSHKPGETSAAVEMVEASDVYAALGCVSMEDPEAYRLCKALADAGYILEWAATGYSITVRPRYAGVVRATQKLATESQEKLQGLLAEGETIAIDIKQELVLNSDRQKGEFVRDVRGLANTMARGRERYLVVGFDDTSLEFVHGVDPGLARDQLEDLLNEYAHPQPAIEWIVVPTPGGNAAMVVVAREPAKVPYRLSRDVWKLKKDTIFVRHGTHISIPNDEELADLIAEGERARALLGAGATQR
jgi:hypothetical protein